jgi:hypothetical protein
LGFRGLLLSGEQERFQRPDRVQDIDYKAIAGTSQKIEPSP